MSYKRKASRPTKNDLRTLSTEETFNRTILNSDQRQDIPLNRAVQKAGFQRPGTRSLSQLTSRYFNGGGVSPAFGRSYKPILGGPDPYIKLLLDARDSGTLINDDVNNVAVLDQSASLAETLVYESDFSVDEDGLTQARLTLTGGNDSIFGKDDVLKAVLNSGSAQHYFVKGILSAGKSYRIRYSYYIPSDNVSIDRIINRWVIGGEQFNTETTLDAWTDVDIKGVSTGSLYFDVTDSTPLGSDADGDLVYIKDIIFDEIQGNHFTQITAANRPIVDSATVPTQIDFDGVSEYLENTLDVSKFAAMSQGSIINICDSNTGFRVLFNMANSANNTDRFRIFIDENEKAAIQNRTDGGATNRLRSTTAISDGDIFEWKLVGGIKKCLINGIEDDIVIEEGDNNSDWMDSLSGVTSIDIATIQGLSVFYYNTTFKHLMIRLKPFTDTESFYYAKRLLEKHK